MITIRRYKPVDTLSVAELIRSVFREFNRQEGSRQAVERYAGFYDPSPARFDELRAMFARTGIFFVATHKNKIIGMVRGRQDKLVNSFVDGRFHKQGVGRRLMARFEQECKTQGAQAVRMRASLYATLFYQRLGNRKTTGIRNFLGLKTQPMKRVFK